MIQRHSPVTFCLHFLRLNRQLHAWNFHLCRSTEQWSRKTALASGTNWKSRSGRTTLRCGMIWNFCKAIAVMLSTGTGSQGTPRASYGLSTGAPHEVTSWVSMCDPEPCSSASDLGSMSNCPQPWLPHYGNGFLLTVGRADSKWCARLGTWEAGVKVV